MRSATSGRSWRTSARRASSDGFVLGASAKVRISVALRAARIHRGDSTGSRYGSGRQAWPRKIASAASKAPSPANTTLISMTSWLVIVLVGRFCEDRDLSSSALSAG